MYAYAIASPGNFMSRTSPTEKLPAVATWLAEARAHAGKTQEQVADGAGIDTTYVGKIELGQKQPSRKVVEALARTLTPQDADEHTALVLLNSGLVARGFLPVAPTLAADTDDQGNHEIFDYLHGQPQEQLDKSLRILKAFLDADDEKHAPRTHGKRVE